MLGLTQHQLGSEKQCVSMSGLNREIEYQHWQKLVPRGW